MGQQWAIAGGNGSGKTSLVRAITGEIPTSRGNIDRYLPKPWKGAIGYVSFELQRKTIAAEEDRDNARFFSGDTDRYLTTGQFIREMLPPEVDGGEHFWKVMALLDIQDLLYRSLRHLSTGEMRKAMIARALVKSPRLLILDEPFDGLDENSRDKLSGIITRLMKESLQIILITHRIEELPRGMTHLMVLDDDGVRAKGPIGTVNLHDAPKKGRERLRTEGSRGEIGSGCSGRKGKRVPEVLVEMRNVTVRYGHVTALRGLNWKISRGENWAVTGPNGSGKTTLLRLISGDHHQAYANDIRLFGRQRGTGESIWDIKRHIGMVGMEFQIRYRKPVTAFETVLSGFFDTVGLYRIATPGQEETARKKMAVLGIDGLAHRDFTRLSHGEQRMALIARAIVKSPLILLLDEPCQGLDTANRMQVLDLIDTIGAHTSTHLLYVTHHQKEIPPSIHHLLSLRKNGSPASTAFSDIGGSDMPLSAKERI